VGDGGEDSRLQFESPEAPGPEQRQGQDEERGHALRSVFPGLVPGEPALEEVARESREARRVVPAAGAGNRVGRLLRVEDSLREESPGDGQQRRVGRRRWPSGGGGDREGVQFPEQFLDVPRAQPLRHDAECLAHRGAQQGATEPVPVIDPGHEIEREVFSPGEKRGNPVLSNEELIDRLGFPREEERLLCPSTGGPADFLFRDPRERLDHFPEILVPGKGDSLQGGAEAGKDLSRFFRRC